MDITYEYPPGMLKKVDPGELGTSVMDHLSGTMHAMQGEVEAARQPKGIADVYNLVEGESQIDFTTDDGPLFWSFVKGSRPHFPPWLDAEHPDGLPFPVAKLIAERGTPPHPEIGDILQSYEERMVSSMVAGLDAWLGAIW